MVMPADPPPNFRIEPLRATKPTMPFSVQSPGQRRGRLEIGNALTRRQKLSPDDPPYEWAIVRDVIKAPPAADTTEYVAALCEGIGEHAGEWFIWRTYFTDNRHGRRSFGQYGPQAPIAIDRWISEKIAERGWYGKAEK